MTRYGYWKAQRRNSVYRALDLAEIFFWLAFSTAVMEVIYFAAVLIVKLLDPH